MKTPLVKIRGVEMGAGRPILIQSMTNTRTADARKTAEQAIELAEAGAELVRITVNDEAAAKAVPKIRAILDQRGYKDLPLVGDFHYNGERILEKYPEAARILDKYRINPGNVGFGKFHDQNFGTIIKIAIQNKKPVRIGVNSGSLDPELLRKMMDQNAKLKTPKSDREVFVNAMVLSAIESAKTAEKLGLPQNMIVLSVKMSDLQETVRAYRILAKKISKHPYCLHLGLTEAGSDIQGIVSSTAALAILLQDGIGDTIRVSLTPRKGEPRAREVAVARQILQSLNLRHFAPKIISCPGCGRAHNSFFQTLTSEISKEVEKRTPNWLAKNPKVAQLKIAIMGCVVNGPGESRQADIAISLPGHHESNVAPVYIKGKQVAVLRQPDIPGQFIKAVETYISTAL